MRQFQEIRKIKAKVYSKPVLIGLIVLMLLLTKGVVNIFLKYRESVLAERISRAKLAELESRKESLQSDIENLQSEEGVEEELRTKYNVGYPGEKMIVVVNQDEEIVSEEKGFWKRTFSFITSWFN